MKKYTEAQQIALLRRYLNSGQSQSSYSRELGIPMSTFALWRRKHSVPLNNKIDEMPESNNLTSAPSDLDEVIRLRRELRRLEKELQQTKWKLEASELMIDLAESTYHIPVRKNSGAK